MKVLVIPLITAALLIPASLATPPPAEAQPLPEVMDCRRGCASEARGVYRSVFWGVTSACIAGLSRIPVVGGKAAKKACVRAGRSAGGYAAARHNDRCVAKFC